MVVSGESAFSIHCVISGRNAWPTSAWTAVRSKGETSDSVKGDQFWLQAGHAGTSQHHPHHHFHATFLPTTQRFRRDGKLNFSHLGARTGRKRISQAFFWTLFRHPGFLKVSDFLSLHLEFWVFSLSLSFFLSFDLFFYVFLTKLVIFHTKTSDIF